MKIAGLNRINSHLREQLFRFTPYIIGIVTLALLPPFSSSYIQGLLAKSLVFAVFGMSLDIVMGYTGLISLGHAAFWGTGGYVVGALTLHYGINNFWITAPLAIFIAGIIAAVTGLLALRVSGLYFMLITFALGQLLFSVTWNWSWLRMSGTLGITGITKPDFGIPGFDWNSTYFYYFVFAMFIICFLLMHRIVNSPFGKALQGIRECEPRMRSLGYNTWLYKYIVFILGGLFAGLAGILFAYYKGMVISSDLDVSTSALAMLIVIIGGAGTLYGPCLGAIAIIFLEFFASIYTPERWPIILGVAFIAAIMWLSEGFAFYLSRFWNKVAYGSVKDGSPKS